MNNDLRSFFDQHSNKDINVGTQERKERERIEREGLILDAAERVFFSHGFEQSTMNDVAKSAELSKGSLYNYFNNKKELCIGIVGRSLQLLIKYMGKSLELDALGLDKIANMGKAFLLFKQENPQYYCALQGYRQHCTSCGENSKFLNVTLKENKHINEMFIKIIKEGIKDASINKTIEPSKVANSLWGEFSGLLPGFDLNVNSAESYNYTLKLIINGLRRTSPSLS